MFSLGVFGLGLRQALYRTNILNLKDLGPAGVAREY